jgi:hypothetical protein
MGLNDYQQEQDVERQARTVAEGLLNGSIGVAITPTTPGGSILAGCVLTLCTVTPQPLPQA